MTTPSVESQTARASSPVQAWERQAAAAVRKTGRLSADSPDQAVWSALTTTTLEGLAIPPLGMADAGTVPGDDGRRQFPVGGWDVRAQIGDADVGVAAADVVDEWRNGATSVWLTVGGTGFDPADLGAVLSGIPLDLVPVVIAAAGPTTEVAAAQALSDTLGRRGLVCAPGTSLGGDPVGGSFAGGTQNSRIQTAIRDLAARATDLGAGAVVADGTVAHEQGAGDAAEVGYAVAAAVHYLRALQAEGYSIPDSLALIDFRLAATDDQFTTIAKFRALRVLWTRVADLCGGATPARVHAVTSRPMMTRYDPWTNLLRTTVAAFAAGVGGATALTVLPFDSALGMPGAQGRSLARNISALLTEEAHVGDVADPAGGSWAVEQLTDAVADAAWAQFLQIEESGGIMTAIGNGSLRSRFAEISERRNHRIATREQPITGVSEFPNLGEDLPKRRPYRPPGHLRWPSWAAPFEDLRDQPVKQPVFLATLGPQAAHAPRTGFVTNALAAGGVSVVAAGPTRTVDEVAAAFRSRSTRVACVTGTDAAYRDQAPAVIAALRASGAGRIILAGRPPENLKDAVDDHIAAGDDLPAFLDRTRRALAGSDSAPGDEDGTR